MKIEMNERKGEIMVALALALRGTSLLFGKLAVQTMGPFLLAGTRFLIAFVVIGAIFHKSLLKVTKAELKHCALLGLFFLLSIYCELTGLKTTDSSIVAFLEGLVVIMVPILTCIIYRKRPDKMTVITSLIALAGVGFLTLKGGHIEFTAGELWVLGGMFWYSCCVLVMDTAAKNDDPTVVAIYQLFFIGAFSMIAAFIFEEPRLPQSAMEWGSILALALVCSGVGFTLQPYGQKYTTPERAGLLAIFNPLTAAALGIIFLHEKMTWSIVIGAILIFIATLAPAWVDNYKARK